MLLLPPIGDAVAVAVNGILPLPNDAIAAICQARGRLAGPHVADLSQCQGLRHDLRVHLVAVQRGPGVGRDPGKSILCRHGGQRLACGGPGAGELRVARPAGGGCAQRAVIVDIGDIVLGPDGLVSHLVEVIARAGGAGARYEYVPDDIVQEMSGRIPRGVPRLVIVDHVVYILSVGLGQRTAVMRIGKEVPPPRDAVALDMGGELLADGVGEDAVLDRDMGAAHRVDPVVLGEFD